MKKYLWFRNKTYGYGWYPVTWEGWLCIFIYFILVGTAATFFSLTTRKEEFLVPYLITVFIITAVLILIAYLKGEKPRWSWGEKKK